MASGADGRRVITVDDEATIGSTVGVDLRWPNGAVVTEAELRAAATPPGDGDYPVTYWRLLREIPLNVVALAETETAGLYVVTGDGTSATRAIELADGELVGSNLDGVAGNPSIGLADVADAGGGEIRKFDRDEKGRVSGTSTATTDDLPEGAANLYFTNARADARIEQQKGQSGGLATLDAGSKLDAGQLPALAITETFVVATEAEMLALVAQQGDVAVRTDVSTSYILTVEPASTLANWQELLVPTGGVTSFNGRTGSVTPSSGDYTFAQISSKPTTLSGYGITDAATAAQGALADSALQPADLPTISSGVYTPTAYAGVNATGVSGAPCRWIRVGSHVMVAGRVNLSATTSGATTNVDIDPPVASGFTAITDMAGAGTGIIAGVRAPASMQAQTVSDRLGFYFVAPASGSGAIYFSVGYDILP